MLALALCNMVLCILDEGMERLDRFEECRDKNEKDGAKEASSREAPHEEKVEEETMDKGCKEEDEDVDDEDADDEDTDDDDADEESETKSTVGDFLPTSSQDTIVVHTTEGGLKSTE